MNFNPETPRNPGFYMYILIKMPTYASLINLLLENYVNDCQCGFRGFQDSRRPIELRSKISSLHIFEHTNIRCFFHTGNKNRKSIYIYIIYNIYIGLGFEMS